MKWTLRDDMIRRFRPPNGGWKYVEAATGWSIPDPMSKDFDAACQVIAAHRKQNPGYKLPFDIPSVAEALIQQTVLRILPDSDNAPKWLVPLDDEAKKKTSGGQPVQDQPPFYRKADVRPADNVDRKTPMGRVLSLANGARTISRWLGEGMEPVSDALANSRAKVCSACPMNVAGDWFDRVTGKIAEIVREEVTAKSALNLRTDHEQELGTCDACGCNLRLKVWVPLQTIRERATAESDGELDPGCWILNEP
jgi:hypothetical protein